jgi:hypothetical protein
MLEALNACEPLPHDLSAQLGEAAVSCLTSALERPEQRASALDLLAADALLTYGCEAATLESSDAVELFAKRYGAGRLGGIPLPNAHVQRRHPNSSPGGSASHVRSSK